MPPATACRICGGQRCPLLGGGEAPLLQHHDLAELELLGLAELLPVLLVEAPQVVLVELDAALDLPAHHLPRPQVAPQALPELGLGHPRLGQRRRELLVGLDAEVLLHLLDLLVDLGLGDLDAELLGAGLEEELFEHVLEGELADLGQELPALFVAEVLLAQDLLGHARRAAARSRRAWRSGR